MPSYESGRYLWNAFLIMASMLLTIDAGTIPIQKGNTWTYTHVNNTRSGTTSAYASPRSDDDEYFNTGKTLLSIDSIVTRGDSVFFVALCTDSGLQTRIHEMVYPDFSSKSETTYTAFRNNDTRKYCSVGNSLFSTDGGTSLIDAFISYDKPPDSSYSKSGQSNVMYNRHTDSGSVTVDGYPHASYGTSIRYSNTFTLTASMGGSSFSSDSLQWIEGIGIVDRMDSSTSGNYDVMGQSSSGNSAFERFSLSTYNGSPVFVIAVLHREMRSSAATHRDSKGKFLFLNGRLNSENANRNYFNLRGQILYKLNRGQLLLYR